MAKTDMSSDRANDRLFMRFCAAASVLTDFWAAGESEWGGLHPALAAQLQMEPQAHAESPAAELEARLIAAWHGCERCIDGVHPTRSGLLAALELTLVRNEFTFITYLEAIRDSLAPVDKSDLWHLAKVRFGTTLRAEAYRALYTDDCGADRPKSGLAPLLTKTQSVIAEKIIKMGNVFFDRNRKRFPIEPRLCPLLVGRTGAGKGFVIAQVANRLECHVLHITFGDWVVNGAHSDYMPTLWSILGAISKYERTLVVLDEIDKFDANVSSTEMSAWSRSACNEIWSLLDRRLPIAEFLQSNKTAGLKCRMSHEQLQARVKSQLWILGIGTWEHLHRPDRRQLGFWGMDESGASAQNGIAHKLAKGAGISPELLYRFNRNPFELNYPTSGEVQTLLEQTGVAEAARARGISVDARNLDLSRGGMRVIEDVVTEILLADTP
jgi:hypothetical protein